LRHNSEDSVNNGSLRPCIFVRSVYLLPAVMSSESSSSGPAPAVILVNPQLGENIGTAARAMANFGLSEMHIVDPRDGWPSERAVKAASVRDWVIENANVTADMRRGNRTLHSRLRHDGASTRHDQAGDDTGAGCR
jgi:hypothetical protein